MLHRTIRHQQSVLMAEILPFAGCAVKGLLHGSAIFRMRPLKTQLHSRSRLSVKLEDAEGFFRPKISPFETFHPKLPVWLTLCASVKYISLCRRADSVRLRPTIANCKLSRER